MATKPKADKPKARPRRKPAAKKTASQFPQAFVAGRHFAPGVEVGFWPAHEVGVERAQGQAPFPKPLKTVKVAKDGSISLSGLEPGDYVAAADTGQDGRWAYVQFAVKADD